MRNAWSRRLNFRGALSRTLDHPGVLVAFFAGGAIGVAWGIPWMGWKLSTDASTVLGSAIGALIGAGTATVLSAHVASRSERHARQQVMRVVEEVWQAAEWFSQNTMLGKFNIARATSALSEVAQHAEKASARISLFLGTERYASSAGIMLADASMAIRELLAAHPDEQENLSVARHEPTRQYVMSPDFLLALDTFMKRCNAINS